MDGRIANYDQILFDISSHRHLGQYVKNGIVYVAGDGNDLVRATNTHDILIGGNGSDQLYGNAGNDRLEGGAGDDILDGGTGMDYLDGGEGTGDTFRFEGDFGNAQIKDVDGGRIVINGSTLSVRRTDGENNTDGIFLFLDSEGNPQAGKEDWMVSVSGNTVTLFVTNDAGERRTIVAQGFSWADAARQFGIVFGDAVPAGDAQQSAVFNVQDGREYLQLQLDNPGTDPLAGRSLDYSAGSYRYHRGAVLDEDGENVVRPIGSATAISYRFAGGNQADRLDGANWLPEQQQYFDKTNPYSYADLLRVNSTAASDSTGWIGDILHGMDGDDCLTGDGRKPGDNGYESYGDRDVLAGGRGSDRIYGGGGDDFLFAWQGYAGPFGNATGLVYDDALYASVHEALYHGAISIEGVDEKNFIDGGDGNDVMAGASYNDTLDGGNGNDYIMAGAGCDIVVGGAGADTVYGDSFVVQVANGTLVRDFIAPDVLPGEVPGDGFYARAYFYRKDTDMDAVFLPDSSYNDVIDGGDGADEIFGEIGHDSIAGGMGNDVLFGDRPYSAGYFQNTASAFQKLSSRYHGDDVVDGGAGNDRIIGGGGADHLSGADGDDTIYGDVGAGAYDRKATVAIAGDPEQAIKGSDTGWWGSDVIFGGAGNDVLVGEGNDDWLDGGDGADTIYGDWAAGQTEAFDNTASLVGNDTLTGGNGNDQLMGNGGDDVLSGDAGDDVLFGDSYKNGGVFSGTGNDELQGGAGNDTLYGGNGNDVLDGGSGNDGLAGGAGDDTYVFAPGSGVDTIEDTDGESHLVLGSKPFRTVLADGVASIYLSADGSHRIRMDLASLANISDISVNGEQQALEIVVPDSNDNSDLYINGTGGDDVFLLTGNYGGRYKLNDSGGSNTIQVDSGWLGNGYLEVQASHNGYGSANSSDYFLLNAQSGTGSFKVYYFSWAITDSIRSPDSNPVALHITGDSDDNVMDGKAGGDWLSGKYGVDSLHGHAGDDRLDGEEGFDFLYGGAGNDSLSGGSGNDVLYGDADNDVLDGGEGNDTLYGGAGDDVFILNGSSNHDIAGDAIFDGDTVLLDVTSDQVHVDAISINRVFADNHANAIASIRHSDNDIATFSWARLQGLSVQFSDGERWDGARLKQQVFGGSSVADLIFGDVTGDVLHGQEGNDALYGAAGDDLIYGDADDDLLLGNTGNDVLNGGTGNDMLVGGHGDDTFCFGKGYGADIAEEISGFPVGDPEANSWSDGHQSVQFDSSVMSSDVRLARVVANGYSDLVLTIISTGETLTLRDFFADAPGITDRSRVLSIGFADGTTWDMHDVQRMLFRAASGLSAMGAVTSLADMISGNSSSNYLYGDAGNDTLVGNGGNDWLDGGVGDDTLTGGAGADIFRFGEGHDVVTDAGQTDRVRIDFTADAGKLAVEWQDGTGKISISRRNGSGLVTGSMLVDSTLGYLVDYSGKELAIGKDAQGNTMSLLSVPEKLFRENIIVTTTYPAESGFVVLGIGDLLDSSMADAEKARWMLAGVERVSGSFGIDARDADNDENRGEEAFFFVGNAGADGGNCVAFQSSASVGFANFRFTLRRDDGLVLTHMAQVHAQAAGSIGGTAGNDVIDTDPYSGMVSIDAGAGDDLVRTGSGSDVVHGGDGDDVLSYSWGGIGDDCYYGDAGNDVLDAGWGSDVMNGGSGNDLYIEGNLWSGDHTVIDNTTAAAGDVDVLQIGLQGYGMADYRSLWFTQDGDDLLVTQLDALEAGEIRVKDWFDAALPEARLDGIRVLQDNGAVFSAGTAAGFDALVQAMAAFSASHGVPHAVTADVQALHDTSLLWVQAA